VAQAVGLSTEQLARDVRENPERAFLSLLDSINRLREQEGTVAVVQALDAMGLEGQRAGETFLKLGEQSRVNNQGYSELGRLIDIANTSMQEGTAIQEKFGIVSETQAAQWQILMNQVNEVFILIGEELQGATDSAIQFARDGIQYVIDNFDSLYNEALRVWSYVESAATETIDNFQFIVSELERLTVGTASYGDVVNVVSNNYLGWYDTAVVVLRDIQNLFVIILDTAVSTWNDIDTVVTTVTSAISDSVAAVVKYIVDTSSTIYEYMTSPFSTSSTVISGVVTGIIGWVGELLAALEKIPGVSLVVASVQSTVNASIQAVNNTVDAAVGLYNDLSTEMAANREHTLKEIENRRRQQEELGKLNDGMLKSSEVMQGLTSFAKAQHDAFQTLANTQTNAALATDQHTQSQKNLSAAMQGTNAVTQAQQAVLDNYGLTSIPQAEANLKKLENEQRVLDQLVT
ncbi:MAG: hypothetical protein MN733_42505, partial [Nitrososphaera sp.]|nr:hypothetical protein [Nitrososphaera sp.]